MKRIFLVAIVLVAFAVVSCHQNNKYSGFENDGHNVWYKIHTQSGDSLKPHYNDYVTVKMKYYLKDTVLFESKTLENDFVFPVIKPMFKGDIYDGMKLMATGDSFTFAVVADSFYYKTANLKKLPDFVTPGELLYFDIKMLAIQTQQEHKKAEQKKLQQEKLAQQDSLRDYLKKSKITVKPLATGLIYTVLQKGYGRKPAVGEMCQVFLRVEAVGLDYELFDNFKGEPIFIEYGKPFDTKGLMEGLGMMKEGEVARLIVPAEIGVGQDGKGGTVPPFSTIVYKIKLDKLKTREEVKEIRKKQAEKKEKEKESLRNAEPDKISNYIKKHNITTRPTNSGLYYIPLKEGKGPHPVKGNTLSVHYTLYNINDEKLFSTYKDGRPFMFVLGSGAVIPGWEEALPLMRKGGKAKLIIPSKLGYKGVEKKSYHIPAYSPLIIELELTDIIQNQKQ